MPVTPILIDDSSTFYTLLGVGGVAAATGTGGGLNTGAAASNTESQGTPATPSTLANEASNILKRTRWPYNAIQVVQGSGDVQGQQYAVAYAVAGPVTSAPGGLPISFVSVATGTLTMDTAALTASETLANVAIAIATALNANTTFKQYYVANASGANVIITSDTADVTDNTMLLSWIAGAGLAASGAPSTPSVAVSVEIFTSLTGNPGEWVQYGSTITTSTIVQLPNVVGYVQVVRDATTYPVTVYLRSQLGNQV